MVRLGAEVPALQKLQAIPVTLEEVGTRPEFLHRMRDQIKIIELHTGRIKEVSRKTLRGAIQNCGKLCQRNGRSWPAAPKPQKSLAYSPAVCRCPIRNGDRCALGTSTRS